MFSLEKVALLEQSMACGESADGKSFKADAALSELEGLFRASTPLSPIDGLRLLMIYAIVHGGIKPDDRRRMMDAAGIGPEDQVFPTSPPSLMPPLVKWPPPHLTRVHIDAILAAPRSLYAHVTTPAHPDRRRLGCDAQLVSPQCVHGSGPARSTEANERDGCVTPLSLAS
mmetsp:Transcript_14365/g.39000  ORF Transcript_14365/g.39000 Transcript_14365/m.39000 type:complete len:171 (+) Transcript_14365:1651-2163(+)